MAEHFDPWQAMRDAAGRLHDDPEMIRALTTFVDFWGLDCYTPPPAVMANVRDLATAFVYAAKIAAPVAGYVPASEVQRAREEALAPAAADVLAERRRQVDVEGWTPGHDDTHCWGEIAAAAACYADHASSLTYIREQAGVPDNWPWDLSWWKPTDRRRDLVKAGALILAEIERLDRDLATPPAQEETDE